MCKLICDTPLAGVLMFEIPFKTIQVGFKLIRNNFAHSAVIRSFCSSECQSLKSWLIGVI